MPVLGQRVAQLEGQMQEQTGAMGDLKRVTDDLRVETLALRGETMALRGETKDLRADMKDLRTEMDRRFDRMDGPGSCVCPGVGTLASSARRSIRPINIPIAPSYGTRRWNRSAESISNSAIGCCPITTRWHGKRPTPGCR